MRLIPMPLRAMLAGLLAGFPAAPSAKADSPDPIRIMAAGDSITEGLGGSGNWRFQLATRLANAGYCVEFVGSRSSLSPAGPLRHEGHGGKNVEFLAAALSTNFATHPADIVLLHAGHNHFAEEDPVPGMVQATESAIAACRAVNPRVTILLARVIPSAKLPKYGYLPGFNGELPALAARLNSADSPVILVDQWSGYDPVADNQDDRVHPNASGSAKIAQRWFEALVRVLPAPHPTPR